MKHGTSGDQVHDILMDWQAEQERVAEVMKLFLSLATDAKCIQSVKWTTARDTGRSLLARLEGKQTS